MKIYYCPCCIASINYYDIGLNFDTYDQAYEHLKKCIGMLDQLDYYPPGDIELEEYGIFRATRKDVNYHQYGYNKKGSCECHFKDIPQPLFVIKPSDENNSIYYILEYNIDDTITVDSSYF